MTTLNENVQAAILQDNIKKLQNSAKNVKSPGVIRKRSRKLDKLLNKNR